MILSRWTYLMDDDLELVLDALVYRREMVGGVICSEHFSDYDKNVNTKLHKRLTDIIDEIKRERYGRRSGVRRQQMIARLEIKPV